MYPVQLPQDQLLRRLARPEGKVRAVLDTDTYNEIDDQFAVVYALLSPERLQMEAFYAAPFHNELSTGPKDGMEKSYRELSKILTIMGVQDRIPAYPGSEAYLPDASTPVESEAARDLVRRAMASPDGDPLYVIAIGAITNIASAILLEPRIVERVVVVWLGGHALHWDDTREFNLMQDVFASRIVLDSGVPLVLVPCMGVASHLLTTLSEVRDHVKECGAIGDFLYETYKRCRDDHAGYSRVIWDISAIAWLVEPEWLPSSLVHSPIVSDDCRWSVDHTRHFIRYIHSLSRDHIFRDMFAKLRAATT